MENVLDFKSPNFKKLISYGFAFDGKTYSYATDILDGQFEMRISIDLAGTVKTQITDLATDEPYTLHLVEGAGGAFVGAVRAEYERIITDVAESCFERDVFKSDCAHTVIAYIRDRYGDELEYLWKTFPSNAVWRRQDNNKWYGVLLRLSGQKLGLDSDEIIDIIDLRVDPQLLPDIVDGKRYFPGYHMNKKNWLTIPLDGSVPADEICARIDDSYNLAKKK